MTLVSSFISQEMAISNPGLNNIDGDEKEFLDAVKIALETERDGWVSADEKALWDLQIDLDNSHQDVINLKEQIEKTKNSRFDLELCHNIKVGSSDDFISMPIENYDGNDAGDLTVYGYKRDDE